ncbi:MAG: IclR family transcriptional regulator [Anaerolineae bacterium]|nr:IclR family transcriptional regulator [Anaerolineae bacterium]
MSEIQSLARGLKILDKFAQSAGSLSITQLAQELELDKSTVSRLVQTLVHYEYAQPDPGTRRYMLGRKFTRLSWQLLNRTPIRDQAKPFLYSLMHATGECAHTAVYSEKQALVIDDVEAPASLRVVGGIGRLIPLHCTAVGKCLLAFSNVPLPADLPGRTHNTITALDRLHSHLDAIRQAGYALDDEENDYGVRCIAAPIYDHTGQAIACIGISGPTVRMTDDRLAALASQVIEAARALSRQLQDMGYEQKEA